MLRLALPQVDPNFAAQLSARLSDATIVAVPECDALCLVGDCDLAACDVDRALQSGKLVLIAANSSPAVEQIRTWSQAAKSKTQLAVWNADRFRPSRRLLRTQLDTGKLGGVGLVRIHRWETIPTKYDGTAAPGALVRDLDLLTWLAGSLPERVYATGRSPDVARHEPDGVGTLQLHFGFADGAMALVDYTDRLPAGDGYQSVSVIASTGAAYADDHQNRQLLFRGGVPQAPLTDEGLKPLALMLQEFAGGVAAGTDFSPSVAAWKSSQSLFEAARRSLETKRAIVVKGNQ